MAWRARVAILVQTWQTATASRIGHAWCKLTLANATGRSGRAGVRVNGALKSVKRGHCQGRYGAVARCGFRLGNSSRLKKNKHPHTARLYHSAGCCWPAFCSCGSSKYRLHRRPVLWLYRLYSWKFKTKRTTWYEWRITTLKIRQGKEVRVSIEKAKPGLSRVLLVVQLKAGGIYFGLSNTMNWRKCFVPLYL